MTVAVFWDTKMTFHRLVEDSACPCEAVTPLLLSAPFYRGKYSGVIIPTGFGNMSYSKLLPALRACSERIERYLEAGGKLLVFGAADASPNRYDWLPVDVEYHYAFGEHCLDVDTSSPWSSIFDGYDTTKFAADGCLKHMRDLLLLLQRMDSLFWSNVLWEKARFFLQALTSIRAMRF